MKSEKTTCIQLPGEREAATLQRLSIAHGISKRRVLARLVLACGRLNIEQQRNFLAAGVPSQSVSL